MTGALLVTLVVIWLVAPAKIRPWLLSLTDKTHEFWRWWRLITITAICVLGAIALLWWLQLLSVAVAIAAVGIAVHFASAVAKRIGPTVEEILWACWTLFTSLLTVALVLGAVISILVVSIVIAGKILGF